MALTLSSVLHAEEMDPNTHAWNYQKACEAAGFAAVNTNKERPWKDCMDKLAKVKQFQESLPIQQKSKYAKKHMWNKAHQKKITELDFRWVPIEAKTGLFLYFFGLYE